MKRLYSCAALSSCHAYEKTVQWTVFEFKNEVFYGVYTGT